MITSTQQAQLEEQGYTVIPGYLTREKCAQYRNVIDTVAPPRQPRELENVPRVHVLRHPIAADPKILAEPILDQRIWDIARVTLRSVDLFILEQVLIRTDPGPLTKRGPYGWHIDQAFHSSEYLGTPRKTYYHMVHCLSSVKPGGGAFTIIPGSHRQTLKVLDTLPVEKLVEARRWNPEQLGVDVSKPHEVCANEGDLLIFNPLALHSASTNIDDTPRYVMFLSFVDASAKRNMGWIRETNYQRDFPDAVKKCLPPDMARRLDLPVMA